MSRKGTDTSAVGMPARLKWIVSASVPDLRLSEATVNGMPSASAVSCSSTNTRGWIGASAMSPRCLVNSPSFTDRSVATVTSTATAVPGSGEREGFP